MSDHADRDTHLDGRDHYFLSGSEVEALGQGILICRSGDGCAPVCDLDRRALRNEGALERVALTEPDAIDVPEHEHVRL